jgi:hypothetical protein
MKEVAKKDAPAVAGGVKPTPQGSCTDVPDPAIPDYPQFPSLPGPIERDINDPGVA